MLTLGDEDAYSRLSATTGIFGVGGGNCGGNCVIPCFGTTWNHGLNLRFDPVTPHISLISHTAGMAIASHTMGSVSRALQPGCLDVMQYNVEVGTRPVGRLLITQTDDALTIENVQRRLRHAESGTADRV